MQKSSQSFQCYRDRPEFVTDVITNLNRDLIEQSADLIAMKLNSDELSLSIRWLWVGNFIDAVVRCVFFCCAFDWVRYSLFFRKVYANKSYGEIALFIKECLNIPGKIEVRIKFS
jgi:hypothetical protein